MQEPMIAPPGSDEYGGHFATYIRLVPQGDIQLFLASQLQDVLELLRDLPEGIALQRHPPYTWSIKQVVGHITDCERIFAYRALRIARNDVTPLPGFDENAYMASVDFDHLPFEGMLTEFDLLRQSHLQMLRHLAPEALQRRGTASGIPMSARAFIYAIAGHAKHHLDIVHKRLVIS